MVEVGRRYEFKWPARNPSMRLVGTVVAVDDQGALVEYDKSKPPHRIYTGVAKAKSVGAEEVDAFQIKQKPARRR